MCAISGIGYLYGVPRNRNMVAWGQRAGVRWFGEHVTLHIVSQDNSKRQLQNQQATPSHKTGEKQNRKENKTTAQHNTTESEII